MSTSPSKLGLDEQIDPVAARLAPGIAARVEGAPGGITPVELEAFVATYFARSEPDVLRDRAPADLAGLVTRHLALGSRRDRRGTVVAVTPSEPGWDTGGSTVIQLVTDDRPFLVDTVSMVLNRRGWSIRNLYHPQFAAVRDEAGLLVDAWPRASRVGGVRESWICLEVYAPLGQSADALAGPLVDEIREALAYVGVVVDDHQSIMQRLDGCLRLLDDNPQPVSPLHVRRVTDLLRWLVDDHFLFLGYREYRVVGDRFLAVPDTGLGILRADDPADQFHAVASELDPELLVITKDSRRSPVHRPAYLDYLGVRVFDREGRQVREHRFLGLLGSSAYTEDVARIPLLRDKAASLASMSGFEPDSHGGKAIAQVVNTYPRDELFQAGVDELFRIVDTVASLQERRQVRLFIRPWRYGRFLSCTVYIPRDRYTTALRLRIQEVLTRALGAESLEYQASVTESVLARLFMVVKLPNGADAPAYDVAALERELSEATRNWSDRFRDAADAELAAEERGIEFDEAYQAAFTAHQALADLRLANELADADDLRYALYAPDEPEDAADLRLKVLSRRRMTLTRVMPHLNALGVDVVDERPFDLDLRGDPVFVYDFGFRLPQGQSPEQWGPDDRVRFAEAFDASWRGHSHADRLNRLVMRAGLSWRQVAWLRAIARYLQQAGVQYSQSYVAQALVDHPHIAAALVRAFSDRFDPALGLDPSARAARFEATSREVEKMLDAVTSLDVDRILRMFLAVLSAMVRTNAFAADAPALAFKLLPRELSLLPAPRPAFEIFVSSPRVQGVHLRFGQVARGGLRWSDRPEDFRTEVLGLVKAQMVKNTVIVPVGAKGGFVPQELPDPAVDRQAWLDEGVACYELFISSLLSLTDNIVDGSVVPPPDVVRHDGDDPYLVVAADKGTATFSDRANRIAVSRGFWLGDAFASGGSAGYDHKGMGITARGAWESVKRHFFERGTDCQTTDFTCVGVGDMAGDVFGNGMLLSRHTRLVAAFNHQHIFLDPNPDAASSFAERERLFALPRSTWRDYDTSLISEGGGVHERSAKSIEITPQVRDALGLDEGVIRLTPNEVLTAILTAPVDLFWNGGIGTYVKATSETHAEVGDKANDAVRVNGNQVRAAISGEGGNLGWTQRGRVEYALAGGRVNTDFIDNSAGVDTSDHEVNIKILLAPEVASGRLTLPERDELLASMTDEVADLVLAHNIDQNLALADAMGRTVAMAGANEAWMRALEESGHLDRSLEALPTSAEMRTRVAEGRGLTRPELATMLAYTKIRLAELIEDSPLPDDPYLADRLVTYFPKPLRERYGDRMAEHRLHREIVTTVTVNRFVNSMGITAYHRLANETGADVAAIVRAQLAARTMFGVARLELALAKASGVTGETEVAVRLELQRMTERATRWLLHNRRQGLDIRAEAARFTDGVTEVLAGLPSLVTSAQADDYRTAVEALVTGGLDRGLAEAAAALPHAHHALPVVELATQTGRDLMAVAVIHARVAESLALDLIGARIDVLPRQTRWDTMARAALRDDLMALHGQLTRAVLAASDAADPDAALGAWRGTVSDTDAEVALLHQVAEGDADLARMSVALRVIRSLLA